MSKRICSPCPHPAGHQHGTNSAYVLDRCRCEDCTAANRAYEGHRRRQQAYGRWTHWTDADRVREHLERLRASGIGAKRISELSGVPTGAVSKLLYGVYAPGPGGCKGNGVKVRKPSRRVLRRTAEALFAIEPTPANLAACSNDPERTPLARLHLRSLVALGWSVPEIGRRIGWTPGNAHRLIAEDRVMVRRTVDAAEALFAALCMTLPPTETGHQRYAVTRARNYAKAHGWKPPLALDDLEPYSRGDGAA